MIKGKDEGIYNITWIAAVEDRTSNYKVVLFKRDGIGAGYIQLQKGDEWKLILRQLYLELEQPIPKIELPES